MGQIQVRILWLVLALHFVALSGCDQDSTPPDEDKARTGRAKGGLTIGGSDTELSLVQHLVRSYADSIQKFDAKVLGGGSGNGIEAMIAGQLEIANSSRRILPSELERAQDAGFDPKEVIFAVDAVAIITNSELGVDSLSLNQLQAIYNGTITNWKEVGGPNRPIGLYGRKPNSGTHYYLKQRLYIDAYPERTTELPSNWSVIDAVRADKGGIGYVGIGLLREPDGAPIGKVWAMPICIEGGKSWSPLETNAVRTGEYPLTRPLFQYVVNPQDPSVQAFVKFELSAAGQQVVRQSGFIGLNNVQQEINREAGVL